MKIISIECKKEIYLLRVGTIPVGKKLKTFYTSTNKGMKYVVEGVPVSDIKFDTHFKILPATI